MSSDEKAVKAAYEGVTVAGVLVVARDTGQMLLAQRAMDPTDEPQVQETWEMPGGHLDNGEDALAGALREFREELGIDLPEHEVVHGWRAGDEGQYQGFVAAVPTAFEVPVEGLDPDEVQAVVWATPEEADSLNLRPEFAKNDLAALVAYAVSGNEEDQMDEELMEEPDLSLLDLAGDPIPVHGVVAPEDVESGDARGFNAGSMTARDYRLPFMWQVEQNAGHDKSVVVGSVDRLMRKDGLIHWEGALMPSAKAGEFAEMLAFFGRFPVSVDGDRGSMDAQKSNATKVMWFDAVRASGLTAVSISAFPEAYVAFGPHPDMPEADSDEFAVLRASGQVAEFKRGPGWVTHPRETKRIHDFWTKKGQPGYAKIRWGTPGDFTRAKKLIGEKIGANSPEDLRYLNQIIAQWHHDALGYWPGELGKPGNAPNTPENRRRAARHAASLEEAHESSAMLAKSLSESGWEPVLTASATGSRVLPPAEYLTHHPDSGALVIEEPDANGIRRTYGYAGEWGVCHIGFDGRCVEMPVDPDGGNFPDFHLGRTKVDTGEGSRYLNTGLITYMTEHRDGQTMLTESASSAHFDDITHAWAAVRLGEDERGVWFSGVVLPHVPEEDLVVIEAAGQVSGEWRYNSLRTLLAVSVPGFGVSRAEFNGDEVVHLVASAFGAGECEPTPAEKMAALAQVDAEARFERLRKEWS